MGIFGKEVIIDIFGDKWAGAVSFFLVFAFISGLQMTIAFTETLQAAFGRSYIGLKAEIVKSICLLGIAYIAADSYGLLGIGAVIGIDFICNLGIRYFAVYKLIETKKWEFWGDIAKIVVGTIITSVFAFSAIEVLKPTLVILIALGFLAVILQAVVMFILFGAWHKRLIKLLTDTH
jgi:O-antigen/teichoic acid export membrane protein